MASPGFWCSGREWPAGAAMTVWRSMFRDLRIWSRRYAPLDTSRARSNGRWAIAINDTFFTARSVTKPALGPETLVSISVPPIGATRAREGETRPHMALTLVAAWPAAPRLTYVRTYRRPDWAVVASSHA